MGKFFLVSNLNPAHCGLGTILLRTELSLSYWVMISLLSGGFSNPYLLKTLLRSLLWKTRNLEYPFRKKISRAMSCKENPFYCSAVSWNGEPIPPTPSPGQQSHGCGSFGTLCQVWKDFNLKWNQKIWKGEPQACALRKTKLKNSETDFPQMPVLQKIEIYLVCNEHPPRTPPILKPVNLQLGLWLDAPTCAPCP